jgi:membrane protease YdiL (CAAX protease family)
MKKAIKNSLISISLILFYLFFNYIPIVFLYLIGIDYSSFSKIAKIMYMFICNIVVISVIGGIYYKTLVKDFKNFFNKNIFTNLDNSFKYWLIGFGVMVVSNLIITTITGGIASNEETVRSLIETSPFYMAFDVVIYAPLMEELIFRKSIRNITNNKWGYVLLSGLIFGGLHVISSISSPLDLLYIIPYGSLGIAFAYSYYKSNNIFSTITMHAMHNGLSFAILILFGNIL